MVDQRLDLVVRDRCPACTAPGGRVLLDEPYAGPDLSAYLASFYDGALDRAALGSERYQLIECPGCGSLYQRSAPDAETLDLLYGVVLDHDEEELRRRRSVAERRTSANEIADALTWIGRPASSVRVLDHGSGYGLWLEMAAAFGCQTAATELSATKLAAAQARGHATFPPDGLPPGSFDLIHAAQVFEHLVEPRLVAQELAAALAPGGLLSITVPPHRHVRRALAEPDWSARKESARSLNPVAPLEHLTCFSDAGLRALAASAGLEEFRYPLRFRLRGSTPMRSWVGALVRPVRRATRPVLFRKPAT